MGDPDRLNFEWSGTESPPCSKYLKPIWNKHPKLPQTLLDELFTNKNVSISYGWTNL